MQHITLLGDSIFDNASYVAGAPSVIEQVQRQLPMGWQATLRAIDGDTTAKVQQQFHLLPEGTTHLVLSVGGNDALGCIASLNAPATSVKQALVTLTRMKSDFQANYQALLGKLKSAEIPLMVCTIYDSVPGLPTELRTALGIFNDVILSEAIKHGLPVLDLRMICTEPGDYSSKSPIEPSSQGGEKLAKRLVTSVLAYDFESADCRIFW